MYFEEMEEFMEHPDETLLSLYARFVLVGDIPFARADELSAHLKACVECDGAYTAEKTILERQMSIERSIRAWAADYHARHDLDIPVDEEAVEELTREIQKVVAGYSDSGLMRLSKTLGAMFKEIGRLRRTIEAINKSDKPQVESSEVVGPEAPDASR